MSCIILVTRDDWDCFAEFMKVTNHDSPDILRMLLNGLVGTAAELGGGGQVAVLVTRVKFLYQLRLSNSFFFGCLRSVMASFEHKVSELNYIVHSSVWLSN